VRNHSDAEATRLMGANPDSSTEDLHDAIARGDFPRWTMQVQVMPERDADTYKWHPFDLTKVWPHADYPPIEVGVMELNRNPENYFAEVEQAAFEPSNVVPGIGFSPDKVLQARILSYADAHRYRLGTNYQQVPVNRPLASAATYNRDGTLRVDGNGGGAVDYEPNSFHGPVEDPSVKEPPLRIDGAADRYLGFPCDDEDYYGQPRLLWEKALDDTGRQHLVENIVASMSNPTIGLADPRAIQERMLVHWYKVHPEFGRRVAEGLGLDGARKAAE
jgi:catalase